jgi:voltage-gated potassium channel
MLLERWDFLDSFYMTIITLTTFGYREVHGLSFAGTLSSRWRRSKSRKDLN